MNRGKSKVVAGVLAIVIGGLGIHHFYLGSIGTGVIVLLLACVGLGPLIALIEGIMLLVMSDEDFDKRYNQREPAAVEFVFMAPK